MSRTKELLNHYSAAKVFLILFLTATSVFAQISNIVSSVSVGEAKEQTPLVIKAELFSAENVSTVQIAYKIFGQSEFKKAEMLITGTTAAATIPAEFVLPPLMEYYLLINLKNGTAQTYPVGVQEGVPPVQISIASVSEKEKEILFLSPSAGEYLTQQELFISISFLKAPDNVDPAKTKIFVNNEDISSLAVFTGDLLVLSGDNLSSKFTGGPATVRVDVYDKDGKLYHSTSRSFQITTAEFAAPGVWTYNGVLKGESRSEAFNSQSTWYNNVGADFNAAAGAWSFNANGYLTSEEVSSRQPYNRYSLSAKAGDVFELQLGDAYPRFPNLILDGKRVRGLNTALNLGFINVQAAYGETDRAIEGKFLQGYSATSDATLQSDVIAVNQSKYGFPYAQVELGTFSRKLLAVRPSFGSGENFQFGLSYLHAKDDVGSIDLGARPAENLVLGSDLMFAFDHQNIMFISQAAVSLNNSDISGGNISDQQIDQIFGSNTNFNVDKDVVKKVRDIIGSFITVNQYLGPWNPQELASVAAEAALSLNYLNNNLRGSYIYRGNDFQSFGQSFLRTDVKGINFTDRIRMIDNKLFISFGYEDLQDNLQKTKIATTTYKTVSASVSIFPRADFPNITIGYTQNQNSNGISKTDPTKQLYSVDDNTNRVMVQMSYDFNLYTKHSSSFSFSTSTKEDNSFLNLDTKFNTGSFNLTSYWNSKITSFFGLVFSSSQLFGTDMSYFTLTMGGKYKMLEDKLQLSALLSPSFGDFKRQAFEFTADYNVLANLNLIFQARVFRIPDVATNSIFGLTTRLTI